MTAHPVTVRQARRDMRWSVQQADTTAEQQRRRHQQIARLIERLANDGLAAAQKLVRFP